MGEKFGANPVNGTGSMTIPIPASPGRGGFGPQLALSYDSGAGNGAFGMGWSLGLPSITRKTDKGLPQYHDAEESDVYLLSGAEDLVPVRVDGDRHRDDQSAPGYVIHRYRPRIEGLFARIERWTHRDTGDIHWRSISRDNITTVYGETRESRISDPSVTHPEHPARTFQWLICRSHDDKGNAMVYEYTPEDAVGVDLGQANERNRVRTANRYLKRILYGNRRSRLLSGWEDAGWLFELVFDYDEAHLEDLPLDPTRPAAEQHRSVLASASAGRAWTVRPDPISTYRAGFEVRTYRRCRRVLMFHRFEELNADRAHELGDAPYLVRSLEFNYRDLANLDTAAVEAELAHHGSTRFASFIQEVTQSGFVRDDSRPVEERNGPTFVPYIKKSLPPLEFEYSKASIQEEVRALDSESAENLPVGVDGSRYQFVDLDGEGLSGIVTQQAGAWLYKENLGEGRFGAVQTLPTRPGLFAMASGGTQLLDLAGDGRLDVVSFGGPTSGFYERTHDATWAPFRSFRKLPNLRWDEPNLRFGDLNGDGHADVLITEEQALTWYASLAEEGFEAARRVSVPGDEERGPHLVFADGTQSIYLADLSGDGLTDLVRIRNGEVCYWPNLGYGRFGAKVSMDNAPWFDSIDQFDQRRIRLADIDGSGTTDILYIGGDGVRLYFNRAGNSWSEARGLPTFPVVDGLSSVVTADLLGNGTACLVWSSALPADARSPLRYVDLMGGHKPHLLERTRNNLGSETSVEYVASTHYYLADKQAGTPWITKLPFPVHCVAKVTVHDRWRKTRFSSTYSYHHGYFDGHEREFRGFGRVEQVDSEHYGQFAAGNPDSPYITDDRQLYQPPIKTVTWYHTGALLERTRVLAQFEREYFPHSFEAQNRDAINVLGDFRELDLPEPDLSAAHLSTDELREAHRACKGMMLRQEIYELDVDALASGEQRPVKLFTAAYHNCHIRRLQERGANRHAVFLVTESEAVTYHYELDLRTSDVQPDPRVAHSLNLQVDEYGNVLQTVAVAYPRFGSHLDPTLPPGAEAQIARVQDERHLVYTETRYTNDYDESDGYRLRVPCEVLTYELTGVSPEDEEDRATADPRDNLYFTLDELRALQLSPVHQSGGSPVPAISYHERPDRTLAQKRIVEHVRTLFFDEDLVAPLPLGQLNHLALPCEVYKLALTDELLSTIFTGGQLSSEVLGQVRNPEVSGYLAGAELTARFPDAAGEYWVRSGTAGFEPDASEHFFLPERYIDPFGNVTRLSYDRHDLFPASSTDPLGNTTVLKFEYRVLSPRKLQDPNQNLSEVLFDALGMPIAVALKGKGTEGDSLGGFDPALTNPPPAAVERLFTDRYTEAEPRRLLDSATMRHLYWFGERVEPDGTVTYGASPAGACNLLRETHVAQLAPGEQSRLQVAFEYSDGGGNLLVTKALAEPAPGQTALRWLASGKTILNNKGKSVKQYEPYFSPSEQRFEEPQEVGVTPVLYYDGPGRVVRTEQPDGSYSRVTFSPWHVTSFDANDTVLEPGNAWYAAHTGRDATTVQIEAAQKAAAHADTPGAVFLDSLGREVLSLAHNRYRGRDGEVREEKLVTFTRLVAEGKPLYIRDPRGNLVMQYLFPVLADNEAGDPDHGFSPCYDIAGNLLFQHSMDAGDRWMISDAAGQPLYTWDRNDRLTDEGARVLEDRVYYTQYDALRRPVEQQLRINGGAAQVVSRIVYGETYALDEPDAALARNLRGQVYEKFDPSGLLAHLRYDFKGAALEEERRLVHDVRAPVIDWSAADPEDLLERETFRKLTEYDALGRMMRLHNWHRSAERVVRYEPRYNERGLLASEDVVLGNGRRVPAVSGIEYNAKGQRERIAYGNGTLTRRSYDAQTFRLAQIRTTRPDYDPPFPQHHSGLEDENIVQQLNYTYDAAGNITEVYDEAFEPVFFAGERVEARSCYTYDALYRLITATGRENAAATDAPPPIEGRLQPSDFPQPSNSLRNYTQHYRYDGAGNIVEMAQVVGIGAPSGSSWTRHYEYVWPNNRLSRTWFGTDDTEAVQYRYDLHGSMASFANVLPEYHLRWDHRDMIRAVNRGGGGWVHYNYDSEKQRTRKVATHQNGYRQWERLYLGGAELHREFAANGDVEEEIETHHLFVDDERVLIIDDVVRTGDRDLEPGVLYRYQYSNHLGSVGLELNEDREIVSYEEYHPYGTAAYRARGRGVRATKKRYRYTGMERDGETGLSYHTARYYSPWLGRWGSADPAFMDSGPHVYMYAADNPLRFVDRMGLYEEPVHGALTYQLAMAAGFTEQDAAHLALATAGVDHDPSTAPVSLGNIVNGVTAEHHFPTFSTALFAVRREISRETGLDLGRFGVALHALQDVGFAENPGPHLRRSVPTRSIEVFSGIALRLNVGGRDINYPLLPPISVEVPGFGVAGSQQAGIGVGHPFYVTERGNLSGPTNHVADQAFQDPQANTRQLLRVFAILEEAAAAYYGEERASSPEAARRAIAAVVAADSAEEIDAFLGRNANFSGDAVRSYEWWVEHNEFTGTTWTVDEIDSSITTPQHVTFPGGGVIIDSSAGRTIHR